MLNCFKYLLRNINISKLSSSTIGLLRDIEASDLSNEFIEVTNNKLKMIKRTMYAIDSRKLLAAKLMLALNG